MNDGMSSEQWHEFRGVPDGHHELEPGETCTVCGRRKPKKRTETSPDTKVVSIGRLPLERQEALTEALNALCEYIGANGHSYPKGVTLEAMIGLCSTQREELRDYVGNREETRRPLCAVCNEQPAFSIYGGKCRDCFEAQRAEREQS